MSQAPVSFKSSTSLTAYRIVRLSASQTVAIADTTTSIPIGVAQDEAALAGTKVPVAVAGTVGKVFCNDTFAAGGFVTHDTQGRAVPAVVNTAGVYVVGQVLHAVSATGTLAEILINPYQIQIP